MSSTGSRSEPVGSYRDLRVYQGALDAAMLVFTLSKAFPPEERFSMTDQMRRASRSVCTNLAEAWSRRRYPAHFTSKLSDAHGEAEEVRVWLELARRCGYLNDDTTAELDDRYDKIVAQLTLMRASPGKWLPKA